MGNEKLIVFDLDGTLFKTDSIDIKANNEALIQNGFQPKNSEEILECIGEPIELTVRKFAPNAGEKIYRKLVEEIIDLEIQLIPECGVLYPGAADMLKSLKNRGNILALCSNGSRRYVNCILRQFELSACFDEVIYNDKGASADKTELIAALVEKYDKQVSVVVGDRKEDFQAGKENGCITIAAAYGYGKDEKFSADYIANDTIEIESIIDNLKRW
jgi:phosphoglycolate phosphatase